MSGEIHRVVDKQSGEKFPATLGAGLQLDPDITAPQSGRSTSIGTFHSDALIDVSNH
jgi:hypothetical protein